MPTLRNDRSGDTIDSPLSHAEAAAEFTRLFADKESWLWYWVHRDVLRERAREAAPTTRVVGTAADNRNAARFLGDTFIVAMGMGLKRPMLRLHYKGRRFKWYLSARGTLCLKTGALVEGTHDPVGDEEYAGCAFGDRFSVALVRGITENGREVERSLLPVEREFLDRLRADPAGFIAECGKDMGRCCYCNLPLEDPTSKRVGYGKTCAGRWGLPWGDKEYVEKAPSFSKVYNDTAARFCQAVRESPDDEARWEAFADWLAEAGLPRCKRPVGRKTAMPRT